MDTTKDYYAILGVLPSAEVETIQAVYRALSKKYHPDVSREDPASAEAKMREINEAHEILSDAKKRKQYDDARPDTQSAGSTFTKRKKIAGTHPHTQTPISMRIGNASSITIPTLRSTGKI